MSAIRIAVILPHLKAGGIEKSAVRLFNELHGSRFAVQFLLNEHEGELLNELSGAVPVEILRQKRAIRSIPELRRALMKLQPDVVYSGTNARNIAALAAAMLIPRRLRPGILISEHTSVRPYMEKARHRTIRLWLMRLLYPRADFLLSPQKALGQEWLDVLGLETPAAKGLPNPILDHADLELARAVRSGRGPCRDSFLVLSVGRLVPAKGHDVLIRAFSKAVLRHPDLRLDIVGDGPERAALTELAKRLGVADRVTLAGYRSDVLHRMASAGLVVVPSRREGFGNVIVEALAVATPVLATDCPGPMHLLKDARCGGHIVPREDSSRMAEAIETMVDAPGACEAASQAGDEMIRRYSVPVAASEFADLVEIVAAKRQLP